MSITYDGTIYEELSVDVSQQNEFAPRLVKQGDAYTRGYIITLTKNGEPLTIPTENTTALFNCRNKTDKTKRASATGTININGTVTVKVPTVVMEVAGFIQCDISIITASGNDTNILKSTLFYLNCEEAANPNGTTTAAEDSILAGIAAGNIVPPAGPYVPKTRQIAGIDLQDDITAAELKAALSVPTKTSDLTNDSGFLTQHQDISGKMDLVRLHSSEDVELGQLFLTRRGLSDYNINIQLSQSGESGRQIAWAGDIPDVSGKQDKQTNLPEVATVEYHGEWIPDTSDIVFQNLSIGHLFHSEFSEVLHTYQKTGEDSYIELSRILHEGDLDSVYDMIGNIEMLLSQV